MYLNQEHQELLPLFNWTKTENTEQDDLPADCSAVYNRGEHTSGVYTIKPRNSQGFNVYCDTQSGSPWTLIQHRKDGSQDFNETWENYEKGFGRLDGKVISLHCSFICKFNGISWLHWHGPAITAL